MKLRFAGSIAAVLLLAACGAPTPNPGTAAPASSAAPAAPLSSTAAASVPAKPATSGPAAGSAVAKPATAASAKPAASAAASSQDWNAILAAAKKEGTVQCACPPRPDYAKLLKDNFEKAYPDIKLQTEPATLPEIWTRIDKEQQAGQYNWDIYMFGPTVEMFGLKDKGEFDSFRNYMVGPDIGSDADWNGGGLSQLFLDAQKQYIFAFWRSVTSAMTINRDLLPDKITTFAQVMDPKYKGKLVMVDPRIGGAGVSLATAAYHYQGRAALQKMLVDQQAMLVKGGQEQADALVRGGKPIALGQLDPDTMVQFQRAGVKLNLENVALDDIPAASNGGLAPAVFKNPVHPNATKVFVNWLLSLDAQKLLADTQHQTSLRKGVPPVDPVKDPKPGVDYFHTQTEDGFKQAAEMQTIAKQLVP